MTNADWIAKGRAIKVMKLIAHVAPASTAEGNAAVSVKLAAFTPAERRAFAVGANVRVPSEATWRLLCEMVAIRADVDDLFARAARAS